MQALRSFVSLIAVVLALLVATQAVHADGPTPGANGATYVPPYVPPAILAITDWRYDYINGQRYLIFTVTNTGLLPASRFTANITESAGSRVFASFSGVNLGHGGQRTFMYRTDGFCFTIKGRYTWNTSRQVRFGTIDPVDACLIR